MPETKESDVAIRDALLAVISRIRANKPNDRSDKDRQYAIVLTDLEKATAYFHTFIVEELRETN